MLVELEVNASYLGTLLKHKKATQFLVTGLTVKASHLKMLKLPDDRHKTICSM